MEFVRQIIDSEVLKQFLTLPPSFNDVQVEVIVLPVVEDKNLSPRSASDIVIKPVKHSAFGRLNAYANPSLIQEEEGVWEKAAAEKYAIH